MPRPQILNEQEINKKLKDIPLWDIKDGMLVREIPNQNFIDAVGKLNAIAIIAEKLNHHPDLLIYGWNKLIISTKTHDVGGITELDFQLAKNIDKLNY